MIKKLVSAALIFGVMHVYGQRLNIPDPNFKKALLNNSPGLDIDGDGEISKVEAGSYSGRIIANFDKANPSETRVKSFKGLWAFKNISGFEAQGHNVADEAINLLKNPNLTYVNVKGTKFKALWIKESSNIRKLDISGTITGVNVHLLPNLEILRANNYKKFTILFQNNNKLPRALFE